MMPAQNDQGNDILSNAGEILAGHPKLGTSLSVSTSHRYRKIIEPPCRIIYRRRDNALLIVTILTVQAIPEDQLLPPGYVQGRQHQNDTQGRPVETAGGAGIHVLVLDGFGVLLRALH